MKLSLYTMLFAALTAACGSRVVALDRDAAIIDVVSLNDSSRDVAAIDSAMVVDVPTVTDVVTADVPNPMALGCEPDQWCWQSPLPQGNALRAVYAVSATEAWAVGERGTIVRYADGRWTPVASPTTVTLRTIWGSGPNDVWAIGSTSGVTTPSVLVRWDGVRWSLVTHGGLPTLTAIDGSGAANVWLLSMNNTNTLLQRWNGAAFSPAPALPTGAFARSLCVRSATEVWATASTSSGGFATALYRWDGAAWALSYRAPAGSGERFNSELTCPANGVALVGYFDFNTGLETYLEIRDGRVGGDELPLPRTTGPRLVRTPHGDAFYVNGTQAVQWTATGWRQRFTLTGATTFSAVFDQLSDGSAGWLTDSTPFVSSWSGGAWRPDPATVTQTSRVFVSPRPLNVDDPVAVFGDRVWGRRDGARWVYSATPTIANGMQLAVTDAWAWRADVNRTWLVGEAGAIARYNASEQRITAATVEGIGLTTLRDIDGSDPLNVWAVGDGAAVYRLEGDVWRAPPVPLPRVVNGVNLSSLDLTAVDVVSANDVMILGNDIAGGSFASIFFHWNGTAWSALLSYGPTLTRMDRDTAGMVYTVEGDLVRKRPRAGGPWTDIGRVTGSIQRMRVGGPNEIELVVTTPAGTGLYRWDRDLMAFRSSYPVVPVDGIADVVPGASLAGGTPTLWAAGAFGAVLRYEGRR